MEIISPDKGAARVGFMMQRGCREREDQPDKASQEHQEREDQLKETLSGCQH